MGEVSDTKIRRTNINLDTELVDAAAAVLRTARTTDTVHSALREVIHRAARERLAQRDFADLTPSLLEELRRPRQPAYVKLADTSAWCGRARSAASCAPPSTKTSSTVKERPATWCGSSSSTAPVNATEFTTLRSELDVLPNCPIGIEQWQRALEVYEQLAQQGGLHHRAVRHPELLIAAAAEAAGIPVLHYDEDYDRIAAITGQDAHWLAPRGTLG